MRTLTTASVLLALLLAGCSGAGSYGSSSPHSGGATSADPANYHSSNFGEPNNEPFQGVHPGH
ncbi:hypothetical protein AVE30378_00014 [Achromobacter veterisilvae]|uniref:Lipoprotein n=1 Tax=Achromobacter veterisilvae TaxID=2069367 RepID=A0A446C3B5_9BURK|nr:hypothetical protein [Achromobacter veterisilvae]SSW62271.1 hypothetical protein AVE30378_00014 [Achromobacter veterisilvae]